MAKRSLVRKILTFTLAVLVMLPAAVIPKNEAFADERRGIYYYNDGGVGAPPNDLYYQWGTWARVSERVPTWPGGEKVFKYWVDRHPDGMGSRGYYNPGDSIFMDDHRYLHPVWGDAASKQITITYHPNGGVGSIVTETISSGTNYTIKDQGYTRAGYTFDGWAIGTDGSGGNFAVGVTVRFDTNVTLYAKWKAVTTPTAVTYNPNGGNGSIVTVPVNKNSNYLVASQGYTRSGYTFDGYNSNAAGTGTNYSVGQYIFVTESITLYAKWKQDPIQQYTVTYYPNGGTGSSVSVNVNAGSNHTIVSQGYTRSGYSFDGYNSNSAGTGTNYSVGQSITVTGNVTLYAKWKQVQYTVTYNPNGGTGNINTINVNANTYHTVVSQGYTRP
ncbi:MAG: InlB B-repeat-containing protein, partial [Coriobacteriia bacterium]|nr:InlB B-repeat-containing protein [Coriobacteriia bacterium]